VATFLALAASLLSASAHADEPDKARCAAAYERAQELQRTDSLSAARKQLVICSETCPGRLRRDCLAWIDDVDALMPTIVLQPRDAEGRPVRQARVTIDGELLTETVDPKAALSIDPGTHVLRFEHPDLVTAEVRVTVHGAERGREVAITLWRRPEPPPPAPAPRPAPPHGHRASAYVFGIAGALAIAAGAALAIAGDVKTSDLRSSCAPFCPQHDADTVVDLWRLGGAVMALGAASLGIGTYLWFLPPTKTGSTVRPSAAGHWVESFGTAIAV
jgi:hypothetical protein